MDSAILEQAIARLEQATEIVREGWVSGAWVTPAGRVCATGGIMVAQKPTVFDTYSWAQASVDRNGKETVYDHPIQIIDFRPDDVTLAAMTALASAISGGPVDDGFNELIGIIAPWNDVPGRTQDEVIAMYVAATAILRAQTSAPTLVEALEVA